MALEGFRLYDLWFRGSEALGQETCFWPLEGFGVWCLKRALGLTMLRISAFMVWGRGLDQDMRKPLCDSQCHSSLQAEPCEQKTRKLCHLLCRFLPGTKPLRAILNMMSEATQLVLSLPSFLRSFKLARTSGFRVQDVGTTSMSVIIGL